MNGLDLTSWIERASTAGMVLTVGCVLLIAAGLVFFFCGLHIHYYESATGRAPRVAILASGIVLMLCIVLGGITALYQRSTLSDEKFIEHVADAYGLAELDCTLPSGYLDGMTDFTTCTGQAKNGDMTEKTNVIRHYDLIIRDGNAYLYDETGQLMEIQTEAE